MECMQEQEVWIEVPTTTKKSMTDYDELGRVRVKRGNNGQNVRYTYDDNDNLKIIKDSVNRETRFDYDALGRVSNRQIAPEARA